MKKYILFFILLSVAVSAWKACNRVPITGRKQVNLVKDSEINSLSESEYKKFLSENKVIRSGRDAERIKLIGQKIADAVTLYYKKNNLESELSNFSWEFNLVDDNTVNAWCMPGGKVVFYSGILPICEDDNGIAVVMGHEVAHAVAKHGNERMSQGLLAQFGGAALSVALTGQNQATQELFMTAYGVGANVGLLLPFSRKHESEADKLGLVFMTMAGFNPEKAPEFWTRMAGGKGGNAPPEFLSTHPSNETRIKDLTGYIPVARQLSDQYRN